MVRFSRMAGRRGGIIGLCALALGFTGMVAGPAPAAGQQPAQPPAAQAAPQQAPAPQAPAPQAPAPQAPVQAAPQAQVPAPPNRPEFDVWLASFREDAMAHGVSAATLDRAFADVQPIGRVLELDHRQPEFTLTFSQYMSNVVSPERIADGKQRLSHHKNVLAQVARRYGVPPEVVVAMWGIESKYGKMTGNFPVVSALATLAYDGRRSGYFRGELMQALRMVEKGVPPEKMTGSWAGAMGQCQFMPSTYVKFARAYEGNRRPDIWELPPDVFTSAANYLSQIGWNAHERWGRQVQLPAKGVAPELFGLGVKKTLKEWRKLGIRQDDGKPLPASSIKASLIRAETGKGEDVGQGPPYLVYDNFRVIMKWNHSVFFAIAAGTLADRVAGR